MGENKLTFDQAAAHRYFAADCFNRTWDFLDKTSRSPQENEQMLLLAMASLWHWTQRPDVTPQNLSVGHWQISRVWVALGNGEQAWQHAELSLHYAIDATLFYQGYAQEALSRAAKLRGDFAKWEQHRTEAQRIANQITDAVERQALEADLATLE